MKTYAQGLREAAQKLAKVVFDHNNSLNAGNQETLIFKLGELTGSLFKKASETAADEAIGSNMTIEQDASR